MVKLVIATAAVVGRRLGHRLATFSTKTTHKIKEKNLSSPDEF